MNEMVSFVSNWFRSGGPFMWVLLFVLAIAVAIMLERVIFYFFICSQNNTQLLSKITNAISRDKVDEAIGSVRKSSSPLNSLLAVALSKFKAGDKIEDIQEGVEEAAIHQIHRYSVRLNYLTLFANIATLLGLLGTITGLQLSFSSLANVEATKKAAMLANGISQAMITTAFGLIVAVPCMAAYTFLSNRQAKLIKDLDETVVKLLNFMKKKRAA
ncbi:MAG: MotA/TolQ/ExbB proton channel family protein [Chitinispirillaceae bacterium]